MIFETKKEYVCSRNTNENVDNCQISLSLWPNQEDSGVSNAFLDPVGDLNLVDCQNRQKSGYLDSSHLHCLYFFSCTPPTFPWNYEIYQIQFIAHSK